MGRRLGVRGDARRRLCSRGSGPLRSDAGGSVFRGRVRESHEAQGPCDVSDAEPRGESVGFQGHTPVGRCCNRPQGVASGCRRLDEADREDGGTPGFLQAIKTALAIQLKEEMGIENILKREHEIVDYVFSELGSIPNIKILAGQHHDRLGVISFYIDDLHFNLGVKMLNDRFGIQTRGGCSCAGTYGHYLLNVDEATSHHLVCQIDSGDLIQKPGWIRMSIHPTTTNTEIEFVCASIKEVAKHHQEWGKDYNYNRSSNEFVHQNAKSYEKDLVKKWFTK